MELFARAEGAIAGTLEAINQSDTTGRTARICGQPRKRIDDLAEALRILETRSRHARHALERLADFRLLYEDRSWIAHGRFRPTRSGFCVRSSRYKAGKREAFGPGAVTLMGMLERLDSLDVSVRALLGALGQIRRDCRSDAAVPPP